MKNIFFTLLLLTATNLFAQEKNLAIPPPVNDTIIDASLTIGPRGKMPSWVAVRQATPLLLFINNRQFAHSSLQFLTKEDEKYLKNMDLLKDPTAVKQYTNDSNIQGVLKLTVAKKLYKRIKKQEKKAAKKSPRK